MTYHFTPSMEDRPQFVLEENLIPKAIEAAKKVKPGVIVRDMWEGAIYRDLENHDPRFCWQRFLSFITP